MLDKTVLSGTPVFYCGETLHIFVVSSFPFISFISGYNAPKTFDAAYILYFIVFLFCHTQLSILLFLHCSNKFYHAHVSGMGSRSQVSERMYVYFYALRILVISDDGLYLGRKWLP